MTTSARNASAPSTGSRRWSRSGGRTTTSATVIPDVLDTTALAEPGRPAIVHRGMTWNYGRLAAEAGALAGTLRSGGVERGDRVGYWGPKRPEAMAAFYAILRAGAVWVPIDANAPLAWVVAVADGCGLSGLVTTSDRAALLGPERLRSMRICVLLPDDGGRPPTMPAVAWPEAAPTGLQRPVTEPPAARDVELHPADLAAIFYTSGSTGSPKGVMHHHRSLLSSAGWFVDVAAMGPEDRMPMLPPLNFKMSTYALISTVLSGATTLLVSLEAGFRGSDLVDLVQRGRVTVWRSVVHALSGLVSAAPRAGSLPSLRCVMVGGGPLRVEDVRVIRAAAPHASLWHTYGSSESGTICAARITTEPTPDEPVPVGPPLDDARVVHLRDDGSPAGVGEGGEMVVWNPRLMLGYWADPDATASVLVPDPTGRDPDARWFRTRDLVRLRADGAYEFVGRRDDMVKSRGYRVELGQVERALGSHPHVVESAAAAVPHREWGSAVVGFAALAGGTVSEQELRRHVAERLPIYMVPQRVHVLEALPRTVTGKVDRLRLLALAEGRATEA